MSIAFQPVLFHEIQEILGSQLNEFVENQWEERESTKILRNYGVAMTYFGSTKTLLLQGTEEHISRVANILHDNELRLIVEKKRPIATILLEPEAERLAIPSWERALLKDIKSLIDTNSDDVMELKN